MTEDLMKLPVRNLAALALSLAAACNVSASGQIPCVDDASCPASYPVCKSGFCTEGAAGANGSAAISITGVPGKAATDPLRGTINVQVVARASSGVKSVTLDTTGKSYTPDASSTAPVYDFTVDSTKLPDGPTSFTATVTPGDTTQAAKISAAYTLVIDNTPPSLSSAALTAADLRPGATLGVDVTVVDAALASVGGTVSLGSTLIGQLVETSASGSVHHLALGLAANAAAGTYAISITAVDKAGNTSSIAAPPVTVHAPSNIPFSAVALSTAANIAVGGVLNATGGDTVTITVTLPATFVLAPGAKPGIAVGPSGAAGTALIVSGTGPYTAAVPIASQADGSYVVTVTATDIGGNVSAPVTSQFVIDKTAPTIPSGILLASSIAGPNQALRFSFTTSEVPAALIATVNGHTATCPSTLATSMTCTYSGASIAADVASGTVLTGVPVSVVIKDAVGNASSAATASVTFDNQAPTFPVSVPAAPANARPGVLVTMTLKPSEALSAFSVPVFDSNSVQQGQLSDVAPPDPDGTRHLGFAVTATLAAGTYTVKVNGTDLANNSSSATVGTFTVFAPFALHTTDLVLSAPGSVTENGFPAVSAVSGKKTLSGTLTLPISGTQLGSNVPAFVLSGTAATSPTTQSSGSFTYVVGSGDTDGLATVTATLTDVAGNTATTSGSFLIDKTPPVVVGGVPGISVTPNIASTHQGFLVTFSTGEPLTASQVNVQVGTKTLVCAGSTAWSCGGTSSTTVFTPAATDPATVNVTVTDVVGNATGPLSATYTLDTTAPTLGSQTPPLTAFSAGSLVTLCICPSKPLSSLVGNIVQGSTVFGAATEIAVTSACTTACGAIPAPGARLLSYIVGSTLNSGTYSFQATGTDDANNTGTYAPGFSVNGSFSISGFSVGGGTALNGYQAYMGPANATQYSCTDDWTSNPKTGQISVQFSVPGNVTLKTSGSGCSGNNTQALFTDSAGHASPLLGTFSRSGNTVTLNACVPATSATPGYANNATDGVATVTVAAVDSTTCNVSNALNGIVNLKSNAPQVSGTPTTTKPIVGPAQTALSFSFGVSEVPAVTPTVSFTLPGAITHNASCSLSGLIYSCSYSLASGDVASTSGSYAAPTGVTISAKLTDGVGNASTTTQPAFYNTGTSSFLLGYDGSTPSVSALSATAFSPATFGGSTNATQTTLASVQEDLGISTQFAIVDSNGNPPGGGVVNVQLPCGFTTPCAISLTSLANNTLHSSVTYHLQVLPADLLGNAASTFSNIPSGPTFVLDTTLPAFAIAPATPFTVTDTDNGSSCSSTTSITACNLAVTGRATQHLVFAGTATKALSGASLVTNCQPGSCGTSTCSVSGSAFSCTLTVSSTASNSGDTATISLTDTLGNNAASLSAPTFKLDNTAPTLGTVVVTNPSLSAQTSPVSGKNGQQLQLTATASKSLSAATLSAAGIGTGSCTISGSGSSTQVTCLLTLNDSGCGVSACTGLLAAINITDTFGNTAANAGTEPTFTVDNVLPTLGTIAVTNTSTGASSNPVSVRAGQFLQLVGTASKSLSSAVIQTAPGASSGGCSISGSGASTQVTCVLGINSTSLANSGCTTAACTSQTASIRVFDLVGNQIALDDTTPGFTIDDVAPTLSSTSLAVTSPATAIVRKGQQVTVSGVANKTVASATVSVVSTSGSIARGDSGTCSVSTSTTVTCIIDVADSQAGESETATVTLTDALGNLSPVNSFNVTTYTVDNAAPVVSTAAAVSITSGGGAGGVAISGTVISITVGLTDASAGIDTTTASTAVTVSVGGNAATKTAPTCSSNCTRTTAQSYTFTYTFTGGETAAATIPITVSYADTLGNPGTTSPPALQVDLVAPQIANFGTTVPLYNRVPGATANSNVTGTAAITAGNGSVAVCAFDTLDHATGATSCASAGAQANATISTSSAGVANTAFTTSNIADATAQLYSALFVRAFSRGTSSSLVKTAQAIVSLGYSDTGGTNLNLATGVRSTGSAQPSIPLSASATVELASFSQAVAQSGAAEAVGQWESVTTTNSVSPPSGRARVQAAYDAASRKFVVLGGMDSTGAPVADANSYMLDLTTSPPTWTAPSSTGSQVDTAACTFGQKAMYDGVMTYSVDLGKYVFHGGRCLAGTGTTIVLPAIYQKGDAETATPAWTDLAATNESSAKVGIQGGMFSFANTAAGALKGLLFNFGFNDASGTAAQSTWKLEQITTASPTWSNPVTTTLGNRYGANMVGDSGAANLFIFGGIAGLNNTNLVSGGSALSDTLKWNGTAFAAATPTNAPPARAYAAMSLQTQSSADGTASSSFLLYGGTGAECSASALLPNFGAGCSSGSTLEDLYELNATGTAWTHIFTDINGIAGGIGRGSGEKGASVNGFFDTNRFYVYRPVTGAVNAFPLFHTPRVVLTFDGHNEAALTGLTLKNLNVQLTAAAAEDDTGTNAALIGVNVSLWNGSNWGAPISSSNSVNVNLTSGLNAYLVSGKTYVMVEASPLNVNYNYKSLTISAPSATWTVQTP